MNPVRIDPQQALTEIQAFNRKLSVGANTLRQAGDIDVAPSPKEAVYQEDKLVLYRYLSSNRKPHAIPLLIVYALVNRYYVLDLQKDRSTIKGLLDAGLDVYVIDWGYPDRSDRWLTLDDYINAYIDACVDYIRNERGLDSINLLGVCQGGSFSLCYSALHPEKVRSLVTMVTPVDFHTPDNLLSHWVRKLDVDRMVDTLGIVPGELLNWIFLSLKPFALTTQKSLSMIDMLDKPEQLENFMRMEKWINDSPDQAGEAFREFIKGFFQKNELIQGKLKIGARRVDLEKVTMPVLNIYATKDHLVPPAASVALKKYVGSEDYSELAFPGGHIGIYVSGRAHKTVPPSIANWLQERCRT